ncbi:MAG: Spy0128 family protein [Anaerovoracaceae bacterium]
MAVPAGAEDLDPNRVPDVDTSRTDSLTINMVYHNTIDTATPIAGAELTIYQVASLKTRGGGATYSGIPPFTAADVSYEDMTAESSHEAAAKLDKIVISQGVEGKTAVTNAKGQASYSDLAHGVYLVRETGRSGQALAYSRIDPYLVLVPGIKKDSTGNQWVYDVVSEVKPLVKKNAVRGCTVALHLKKTLSGKALERDMFQFRLQQIDADGKAIKGGTVKTAANDGNGGIDFSLAYKKPGTYRYRIREINDGKANIKYDDLTVKALVVVKAAGDGSLKVTKVDMSKDHSFNNVYEKGTVIGKIVRTGDPFQMAMLCILAAAAAMILVALRRKRGRGQ